jgi:hypothetical protein
MDDKQGFNAPSLNSNLMTMPEKPAQKSVGNVSREDRLARL